MGFIIGMILTVSLMGIFTISLFGNNNENWDKEGEDEE